MRSIIHIDMDAFFASVEKLDNIELKGKPVIVGGLGKRGVVATASYEARKYGIKSAMPISKAKKLCPGGIFLSSRIERYHEISKKIRRIFLSYTPKVEPISLDEAFLDVTETVGSFDSAIAKAGKIKREIQKKTGLTCSAGVAPNKFLAKLASDMQKPNGFVVIRKNKIDKILKGLPVSKIWGVGKVTEQKLNNMGIQTINDLKQIPRNRLKNVFGKQGEKLYELARGIDSSPVEPHRHVKSISQEITFGEDLKNSEKVKSFIVRLSEEVGSALRKKKFRAKTVKIKVRFSDFTTITRQISLGISTNSTEIIRNIAIKLFEERVTRNQAVRLIGVGTSNITNIKEKQLSLFSETKNEQKIKKIDDVLDEIREKFGKNIIRRGI
ncbi:DNA polymerase IV [Candidatus Aerophobetes bacterium]|nr:DNA polymerase IV [Candidatus Aerophobetes bacterium]